MPRLSRAVVAERETFTNTNFAAGMSLEQAQEALVAKDGHKMAPKRLKELFDAAEKPEAASVTHPPCETPNCDGKGNACVDAPKEPPKATFPDKPVVPVADATFTASKPIVFTRVYEATKVSKGGGPLMKAGDLARAVEADKYKIKPE